MDSQRSSVFGTEDDKCGSALGALEDEGQELVCRQVNTLKTN